MRLRALAGPAPDVRRLLTGQGQALCWAPGRLKNMVEGACLEGCRGLKGLQCPRQSLEPANGTFRENKREVGDGGGHTGGRSDVKTGRRWGDTATARPRRPPEGAQPCSPCRTSGLQTESIKALGCPGAPAQAPRGETAVRASWTMRGDPRAARHLPRVLGPCLTSQRATSLASQPPSSPEGVHIRQAAGVRSGQGWQLKPDDSSYLPPSHTRECKTRLLASQAGSFLG